MQFRVIVVTDPQTNPQTDRDDYYTLCRSFVSAQCNKHLLTDCCRLADIRVDDMNRLS